MVYPYEQSETGSGAVFINALLLFHHSVVSDFL